MVGVPQGGHLGPVWFGGSIFNKDHFLNIKINLKIIKLWFINKEMSELKGAL